MSRKKKHNNLVPYPDLTKLAGIKQPQFNNAVMLNTSRFQDYLAQLTSLAMARFEWLNLPETVDERFLEFTLLNQGSIAFFNGADENMSGYFATQWVSQKPLNVYLNPTSIRSIGSNGWNYQVEPDQFVIIWDNINRTPTIKTLYNFAYKLTDIDRTLDVLRKHAKMPYVITVPQELKEPAVNLWRQIDSNEPAVLAYKDTFDNITVNAMQTTNTSVPQLIAALQANKQDIMNELDKPGRDPRNDIKEFSFSPDIHTIADLRAGMILPGIVTNITNFGCFVDIGIKENGLVHISELADHFVSDPAEVVTLHQHIRVRVLDVDTAHKRIQLSMKGIQEE